MNESETDFHINMIHSYSMTLKKLFNIWRSCCVTKISDKNTDYFLALVSGITVPIAFVGNFS